MGVGLTQRLGFNVDNDKEKFEDVIDEKDDITYEIDESDEEWWEIRGLKRPVPTEEELKRMEEELHESLDKTEEEISWII